MPTYCTGKEIQYLDKDTGELITSTTERTYSYKVDNEEFMMVYYRHLLRAIANIDSTKALKLLIYLASIADYNTGRVSLGAYDREKACEAISIKSANFNRYINELKKSGIISGGRGSYVISPEYFWKGDSKKRNEILKDKLFYVKFGFCDPV